MNDKVKVTYLCGNETYEIWVTPGTKLREALLEGGFSPYTRYTQHKNCGGNGICATCGVWLQDPCPEPTHWHDKIAKQHGYPRLSCQVVVKEDLTVEAVEGKLLWGLREMRNRKKKS